jgi:DNA-binding response OmpR family regulator
LSRQEFEQKRLSGCGSIGLPQVSHSLNSGGSGIGANALSIRVRSAGSGNGAIGKPLSYPELRARIEALLRRADVRRRRGRLRVGALEIDAAPRVVRLDGTPVELSQKEFALMRTLASDPTRGFIKDELLRTIWGFRTLGSNRCRGPYVRLVRGTHRRRVGLRCRVAWG